MNKKIMLLILDGWGIAVNPGVSAINRARTPHYNGILARYAHSHLEASGLSVGLPEGQMGNSEVGHMNLGAGRVVYQDLVRINLEAQNGGLAAHAGLAAALEYAIAHGKNIHLMGLVSDGGVHAHIDHLKALCDWAAHHHFAHLYIHAFTDGRDTDPKSGKGFLSELIAHTRSTAGTVVSAIGRYYAMDRDKRWERVKIAYDCLVKGEGREVEDLVSGIEASYQEGITDEFIKPLVLKGFTNRGRINEGDVVINFNFRTDRGRQITEALTQQDFPDFGMKKLSLYYITMTRYDESFQGVHVLYEKDNLRNTLGEVLAGEGLKQIRIAETEKYPHVTFFFSGGREQPFTGETRIMCPSPKVATYDLQPEMSAAEVTQSILKEMDRQEAAFICLNFANPDMVGHTGVFEAVVKACETVDTCLGEILQSAKKNGYAVLVIADHGNADYMINEDGSPNTAHSTALVPCILVAQGYELTSGRSLKNGKLGDIAPTILDYLGIQIPPEMTGTSLIAQN
jgi:2,3-bisphosphoglycerate-independent phosphoglycerate mutase